MVASLIKARAIAPIQSVAERHPVDDVVREAVQPLRVAIIVEQSRLIDQEVKDGAIDRVGCLHTSLRFRRFFQGRRCHLSRLCIQWSSSAAVRRGGTTQYVE